MRFKTIKKITIGLSVLLMTVFACTTDNTFSRNKESLNYLDPSNYILQQYENGADVLILGDHHYIKENVDFVTGLIPKLHQKGVRLFFSEFIRHRDSLLIKELMRKEQFDVQLARKISHNNLYQWGYQEYIDLMEAFWKVNHKLPEKEWIHLVGTTPYWPWEIFNSDEDFNDPEKRMQWSLWDGMPYEKKWAKIIAENSLEKDKKAFVFCGFHHGMTEYKQPVVVNGEFIRLDHERMGHYLFNKYGKRVQTVLTHYSWPKREGYGLGYVLPFQGQLDSIGTEVGSFGIDAYKLSQLVDSSSVYSNGYNKLRLFHLCDGYVLIKPICEQNVLTPIPNFVNDTNLSETKRQAYDMRDEKYTAQSFNDSIKFWLDETKSDIKSACDI